jgi:hypothetical protein
VDEGAKQLMDDVNAKMVEWEGKLVALGNAMDKAKALQVSSQFTFNSTFHLPHSFYISSSSVTACSHSIPCE